MLDDLGVKEGESLQEESPTLEQTTEEVEEPKAEVATEEQVTETETVSEGKGANQRIRELNQAKKLAEEKAALAEAKAQSLAQKLAEITEPIGLVQPGVVPQYPQYQDGQEIGVDQVQQDLTKTANAIVDIKIKQNNAINRINNEAMDAVRKYPQLDPDNKEAFNKKLSDSVTKAVEAHVRANPYEASVKQFVDELMEPYLEAVTKEVGQVNENIAKQVSETALRPTSVRKQEKPIAEMSIEEAEQKLGIVHV
jgi:dsRNA-specific ribonuclease